ncbi:GumC family protein [Paracoccus laeviglucosivorans]|uniref:Uncharacterized protein involved in exopolysaccharide biosynthesis n=1 Tax=Paracoccus laeviglucosivorans TaxID=1197861 RepID=A0A521ETB1_9RHOB|nr:GNVR domain-containing protein [Paracoccus laeviglucosivorans]SMO86651.1 Uncharacterized protein involved in exopolysaccharide biosynthesis [Paracoccus laeviglucosivorans]
MNHDLPHAPSVWRNDVPDFALLVRRTLGGIRRNLPVLILGSALAGALATGLALTRPDYYYGTSAIMIDPRLGGSGDAAAAPTIYLADALVVDSEIEVLRSDRLLRRVVQKLQPQIVAAMSNGAPQEAEEASPGPIARLRQMLGQPEEEVAPPPTAEEIQEAQVAWVGDNLTVERQGNTFVILIGFTAEDPRLAADVANAVAQEYVLFQQDDSRNRVQQESAWLSAEMTRLSIEARQAEAAVQKFLVENDVPKDGETGLAGATMTDVEAEIVDQQRVLRSQTLFTAEIDTDIRRLQNERVVGDLLSLKSDNVSLSRLMQQYKDAQRSDGGNTAILARMAGQIMNELTTMREASEAVKEVTEANLAKLEARHSELQAELSQIAATQIELGNLQRESEAVKEQQRSVMGQLQRSQSQDLYIVSDTRVIDDAVPPANPANPPLVLVLATGLIGGFLLSLAWIFMRGQLDDRIRGPQPLRDRLGLSYMGSVPPRPFAPAALMNPGLLAQGKSVDSGQLYDSLRRAAVVLRRDRGTTLVSSLGQSSSRAMLSSSLAAFLTSQGEKVLLVEGDISNRRLSSVLRPQLKNVTPVNTTLDLANPSERLTVAMPNIGRSVDPSNYSAAIAALLASRQDQHEIVIIDGPPLSGAVDEIIAEAKVGKVLLALPFGKVSLHALEQILDRNEGIGRRLSGVFLTDVRQSRLRRHDPILKGKPA